MLIPTGRIIWAREDDSDFYAYTETGQPQSSFRPVITAAAATIFPGSIVSISGLQFNGLPQAVAYGDDYAAATNYPLMRIPHKTSGPGALLPHEQSHGAGRERQRDPIDGSGNRQARRNHSSGNSRGYRLGRFGTVRYRQRHTVRSVRCANRFRAG